MKGNSRCVLNRSDRRSGRFVGFLDDGLESFGMVHGQIGQYLTVEGDVGGLQLTHQLAVGFTLEASGGVDPLNPELTELALLVAAVTVSVLQAFFDLVLCNGPDVFLPAEIALGHLQNLFPTTARSDTIN